MSKIKTFNDACKYVDVDPALLPTVEHLPVYSQKKIIADYKLVIIAKALNKEANNGEDWSPNWDNRNEYKYWPYFDMRNAAFSYDGYLCTAWSTYVGSRLVYKSAELAEYAGKQFVDVYRDSFVE